jgi:hypothetical protein
MHTHTHKKRTIVFNRSRESRRPPGLSSGLHPVPALLASSWHAEASYL